VALTALTTLTTAPATAHAAGECRALVNLELPDGGLRVLDLRLGADLALSRHTGLAIGEGKDVVQLRRAGREQVEGAETNWHLLQGRPVAGGDFATWLDVTPSLPTPAELRDVLGPDAPVDALEASHSVEVMSVFGPYVSLGITRGGYAGGAHGYDDPAVQTLVAPKGAVVDMQGLLGEAMMASLAAHIEREVKADPDVFDGLGPPDPAEAKDSGLSIGPEGFAVRSFLACCTWAANHNLYELDLPLESPSPKLARYLPVKGSWRGPAGCSLTEHEGALLPRGPGGKELPEVGLAEESLLGVVWVAPDAPALRPDDELYKQALTEARRLVKAGKAAEALQQLELAMEAKPGDATAQAEAGWILFGRSKLDDARALTEAALASAGDNSALKGMCLYNLGRIEEAGGDKAKAAQRYRESLELRPNDTVRKRLEALGASAPVQPVKSTDPPPAPAKPSVPPAKPDPAHPGAVDL